MSSLKAPFPYFGGKSRWAEEIWDRLGSVTVYVEPFAGSLAVLLHRSIPAQREIVCDLDGMICNFWRALREDPDGVAYWADYPTFHQDLTARRLWLANWGREHGPSLSEDAAFYDVKAAGWWCWGISNWIGGGFMATKKCVDDLQTIDQRPFVGGQGVLVGKEAMPYGDSRPVQPDTGKGRGVQVQRDMLHGDVMPSSQSTTGGYGVNVQREDLAGSTPQIPHVSHFPGGKGIHVQRITLNGDIGSGARLLLWFHALAQRLARVVVLNRSWESALSPTLLMHTPSAPKPPVGIFLDPPYLTRDRKDTIYTSDWQDAPDAPALASYEWAVKHGETYRIAYACHEGDFPIPDGWDTVTMTFGGPNANRDKLDMVMFSPACINSQRRL